MADRPIRWTQAYPGGRIVATMGRIEIGAVFPDPDGKARWSFWLPKGAYGGCTVISAKTELAAKNALIAALLDWLRAAGLRMESSP